MREVPCTTLCGYQGIAPRPGTNPVLFLLVTFTKGVGNGIRTEKEQDVKQKTPSDLREQQWVKIQ